MSTGLKVFLVDDHDVVRAGMRAILADSYDVVGEADNVDSAIDMIISREPEVVVLDVKLPGGGGCSVIEAVRRRKPAIKFMALTVSTSREDVAQMMKAGVDGYITKSTLGDALPSMIDQTAEGLRPVSADVAGYLLDIAESISTDSSIANLTPREREVVNLIARGYSYKETAGRLDMSVKTLEKHMGNIFDKLSIASRHELTRIAYDEGYVRPDDARA